MATAAINQDESTSLERAHSHIVERQERIKRIYGTTNGMHHRDVADWSPMRRWVAMCTTWSYRFEILVLLVVLFNTVIMFLEADAELQCEDCSQPVFDIINAVLLAVYTMEALLALYVQRSDFFFRTWNIVDSIIVILGYIEVILETVGSGDGLSLVRMVKMCRILRVARLLKPFPELYKLVAGFIKTLKTMFWGFVLIMLLLGVGSIITVQVVESTGGVRNNFESEWCNTAFNSVPATFLLLFQTLIAGDSWGACVIPASEKSWVLFTVFATELIIVQLGFTNLILAVIVDASAEARAEDEGEKMKRVQKERAEAIGNFGELMSRLDIDNSGTLTEEEILAGMLSDKQLSERCAALGLNEGNLHRLIDLMDTDRSGDVSHHEFTDTLLTLDQQDSRVQTMFLMFHVEGLRKTMEDRFCVIEEMLAASTDFARNTRSRPSRGKSLSKKFRTTSNVEDLSVARCESVKVDDAASAAPLSAESLKSSVIELEKSAAAALDNMPESADVASAVLWPPPPSMEPRWPSRDLPLHSVANLQALALEAAEEAASLARKSSSLHTALAAKFPIARGPAAVVIGDLFVENKTARCAAENSSNTPAAHDGNNLAMVPGGTNEGRV